MGRIKGRLRRLEERAGTRPSEQRDDPVGREVLRRMTDEELEAYGAALRRHEALEDATDADRVIADRVKTLYEEVRDGIRA